MRVLSLTVIVLALVMGTLTAQEETGWTCPAGFEGQTLRMYNWDTYIAEDTIPNFEALCGVTVEYSIFESSEQLYDDVNADPSAYDLIVPSGDTVERMIAADLLRPLNFENIPNFQNVSEQFIEPPYDSRGEYVVPYQWGTIGIGYNTTRVEETITTWRQLFDHDGPVAWIDDYRAMFALALRFIGYSPNTASPHDVTDAKDILLVNQANVVAVAGDNGQELLKNGEADMVIEYSGDILQLALECECDDYAYVIPEEGAVLWTDNMAIPIGAQNPELAEAFIDYILDPQVGADLSNFIAYGSPNQAAIDQGLIDEALLNNPGIYPSGEVAENLFFIRSVRGANIFYERAWGEVIEALETSE